MQRACHWKHYSDSIELQGDRRWYKIDLKQARAYEFHQFGDSLQSPSLFLRDKNGVPVFLSKLDKERSTGEKLVLTYECPNSDVYYLDAAVWSQSYSRMAPSLESQLVPIPFKLLILV